jgi:hypothetical protein
MPAEPVRILEFLEQRAAMPSKGIRRRISAITVVERRADDDVLSRRPQRRWSLAEGSGSAA